MKKKIPLSVNQDINLNNTLYLLLPLNIKIKKIMKSLAETSSIKRFSIQAKLETWMSSYSPFDIPKNSAVTCSALPFIISRHFFAFSESNLLLPNNKLRVILIIFFNEPQTKSSPELGIAINYKVITFGQVLRHQLEYHEKSVGGVK